MSEQTLITPYRYSASSCGYCSPSGSRSARASSKKYAFEGSQMTTQFYQDIIDRGWRRSGDFVYNPDISRSCCPQYTIRLDAKEYKPNKKYRQVINRWNRYLSTGSREPGKQPSGGGKGKKKVEDSEWYDELHRYEVGLGEEGVIKFETEIIPAIASQETFELYKRYQVSVHQDIPGQVTMRGFRRFLCDSPLLMQSIKYKDKNIAQGLPQEYGSYHLLYKINGKIIGISVIDILPNCVSSVYFIWDPDWAWASLGKISAMYEASLARRIWNAAGGGGYVYMGYWIANCQKMKYKADYSPSFLLDPETHQFHPLTPALETYLQANSTGYHPFAVIPSGFEIGKPKSTDPEPKPIEDDTEGSEEDSEMESMGTFPSPPPPGFASPTEVNGAIIGRVLVTYDGTGESDTLVPLKGLRFNNTKRVVQSIKELYAALGPELVGITGSEGSNLRDKGVLRFG